jgi:tRNA threonylcarbamoyladenosine biosynthesis protein TsaE
MILANEEATDQLGRALAAKLRAGDVILLNGEMGAGKTALSRGIVRGLGFEGDVPSPTFPILISYDAPDVSLPLAHVDLYRLDDVEDLEELGLDEMLVDGALIVEWPGLLPDRIKRDALNLTLEKLDESERSLTALVSPSWQDRWPTL